MNKPKNYLIKFAQEFVNFRKCEIDSLIKKYCKNSKWINIDPIIPFAIVETSHELELFQLMKRSMLVRSLYELWDWAPSSEKLKEKLRENELIRDPQYCGVNQSFRIQVESYNRKIASSEKVAKIEELSFLDFKGPVNINNPINSFHLIEFYGINHGQPSILPEMVYFGRWLCDGNRRIIDELNLSKRKFISNTSMDVTLSLIMANLANVSPNDLVLDPFVGSGSLLVAAAKFGAYVLGCDIDYLLLHGMTKSTKVGKKERDPNESVLSNLLQYNLADKYMDVIVGDSSLPIWADFVKFDAIITDPPYGIREASMKIGAKEVKKVPEECLESHVPAKVYYSTNDVITDLLAFAERHLKVGGRLVYWLPIPQLTYKEENLPKQDGLKLLYHTEQKICRQSLRILICMEKN